MINKPLPHSGARNGRKPVGSARELSDPRANARVARELPADLARATGETRTRREAVRKIALMESDENCLTEKNNERVGRELIELSHLGKECVTENYGSSDPKFIIATVNAPRRILNRRYISSLSRAISR